MRRILLILVLLVPFLAMTATPAYAPTWCPADMTSSNVRIRSLGSGHFVAAEISWTGDGHGQLRARTPLDHSGPWESFRLVCVQGPDVYAIRSVANGLYVTAEINWSGTREGLLRAGRATSIGLWEQFRIPHTAAFTMRSLANGMYVTTEVSSTGNSYAALRARARVVGDWEYYVFL